MTSRYGYGVSGARCPGGGVSLAGADGVVEVVDVLEAERRQVVVPGVHLLDDPLQRLRRLLRARDDRRDEVRDALVGRQLDALGVDEHHAHLVGRRPHEDRGDHRVDEARLAGAGGARDEQVRHLREVGEHVAALDVLAHADHHGVLELAGRLAAQHVAEATRSRGRRWGSRCRSRTCRGSATGSARRRWPPRTRCSSKRRDPLDLDRLAELDLVAGHGRAAAEAGDAGVDREVPRAPAVSASTTRSFAALRALRGRARSEDVGRRQRVGDVAGELELLDPLRELRGRRRLEHRLGGQGRRGHGRRGRGGGRRPGRRLRDALARHRQAGGEARHGLAVRLVGPRGSVAARRRALPAAALAGAVMTACS